jgi:hypothetical protein
MDPGQGFIATGNEDREEISHANVRGDPRGKKIVATMRMESYSLTENFLLPSLVKTHTWARSCACTPTSQWCTHVHLVPTPSMFLLCKCSPSTYSQFVNALHACFFYVDFHLGPTPILNRTFLIKIIIFMIQNNYCYIFLAYYLYLFDIINFFILI